MADHHLRLASVEMLEAELADYPDTLKAIRQIEEALAMPAAAVRGAELLGTTIRPGGMVSDPTQTRATAMAEYRLLQRMREIAENVAELIGGQKPDGRVVIGELPRDIAAWVKLRYQHRPRLSVDEAAQRVNVDRRTTFRWRRQVLSRLADRLGMW